MALSFSSKLALVIVLLAAGAFFLFPSFGPPREKGCTMEAKQCPDGSAVGRTGPNCEFAACPAIDTSYKNGTYIIEGESVTLVNGVSEVPAAPGSASKIVTRYFGNEALGDLDQDGVSDVVFILTQTAGGSGTFYYAVAARKTESGYAGTNGVLLGDRIAPQTTEIRDGLAIINYADRAPGSPMSAPPSMGVSKYLSIEEGVFVEQSTAPGTGGTGAIIRGRVSIGPICPVVRPGEECPVPIEAYTSRNVVLYGPNGAVYTMNFRVDGTYEFIVPAGDYRLEIGKAGIDHSPELPQDISVRAGEVREVSFSIDTGIR